MQPNVKLDRTLVAVNVDGVVHVMLELTAPPSTPTERAPIDAVLVLDRSGSMAGVPMHSVREAACNLLRLLGPDDRLAVIAFDNEVEVVLPMSSHDVDAASMKIRQIESRGSTNLSGGWLKAFELLASDVRPKAIRRVIVLTDGHANAGVTDPVQLCAMVGGATQQGVSTTMIGFDDGYDEVLLAALADAGSGNDYWCAGPDQAPQVFTAEFEGLASVVAQNISVEVRPQDGVELAVLNEYPIVEVPGGLQVALGDAYGGETRRVVCMLNVPAHDTVGKVELGELVVRWASTVGNVALHTVTIPLSVDAGHDVDADQALDEAVTEQVNILCAVKARKKAHEMLLDGDVAGARSAMQGVVDLLVSMPSQAAEFAQVSADLDELDRGEWSASSTKRMYSATRTTQKGRRSRFDGDDQTGEV